MGKELIENLKSTIKLIKDNVDANTHHFETLALATEIIINHGDWLIEQVERVQELEQALHFCKVTKLSMESVEKYTDDLKQQNKCYRKAIELAHDELFYALCESKSEDTKRQYIKSARQFLDES